MFALAGAALIAYGLAGEVDSSGYWRIVGAIVVADVFLVIVQPVARRLARAPGERTLFAFECTLDRPAGALATGYTASGDGRTVACSVAAAGFAEAVAEAIRTLERGGAEVVRVERRSDAG